MSNNDKNIIFDNHQEYPISPAVEQFLLSDPELAARYQEARKYSDPNKEPSNGFIYDNSKTSTGKDSNSVDEEFIKDSDPNERPLNGFIYDNSKTPTGKDSNFVDTAPEDATYPDLTQN